MPFVIRSDCRPDTPNRLLNFALHLPDCRRQKQPFPVAPAIQPERRTTMANNGVNDGRGNNVAVAIRLRIVDGKIAEIEQLAIRPPVPLGGRGGRAGAAAGAPGAGDRVAAMKEPNPIFSAVIPENERASREDLIDTANYYFTGLARHDGKGHYPFTEGCVRFENGIDTTDDCLKQFTGHSLDGIVSRIRDRRFVAVDRERGVVFAFAFFDHYRINWTWQLAELFKIEKGKIRRIEAVFQQAPFGIPSGWSTYRQSIGEEIQSVR